mmetsp:Transcript_176098/g.564673  ORF Transcript_176098/g.564673 Transcript_176098/m.564673 type:complete len:140 (-) Transcript_176098:105-524(-)
MDGQVTSSSSPSATSSPASSWASLVERLVAVCSHRKLEFATNNPGICWAQGILDDFDEGHSAVWSPLLPTSASGSIVRVSEERISTISTRPIFIDKGDLGVLHRFDDDGDAMVIFPKRADQNLQWIAKSVFGHLVSHGA